MGFFDSMLEINNNFLLIGLIVVAITCIYLLYSNLTKVNDSASLKSTINNLIQQNKKRDEIINFLLERIENLEHGLPKLTEKDGDNSQPQSNEAVANELDDLLDNITPEPSLTVPATELTDLLDSINSGEQAQGTTGVDIQGEHAPTVDTPEEKPVTSTITDDIDFGAVLESVTAKQPELTMDDLETEFEGMFDNVPFTLNSSPVHTVNMNNLEIEQEVQSQSGVLDIDIVSVILEADDIGNMADYEINVADIPKSKDKLNAKYTVKQLKQIAQKMNLNAKGNKTDLVERIYAHLSASA